MRARRPTSGAEVLAALALLNRTACPAEYRRLLQQVAARTGLPIAEVEQRIEALAGKRNVA